VVFGERHPRYILLSYKDYYNATRTHLSLNKDAPVPSVVECAGNIVCCPILALQLLFVMSSESMGDHDSGSDDWWCVG
jgi:hypothetical protein